MNGQIICLYIRQSHLCTLKYVRGNLGVTQMNAKMAAKTASEIREIVTFALGLNSLMKIIIALIRGKYAFPQVTNSIKHKRITPRAPRLELIQDC